MRAKGISPLVEQARIRRAREKCPTGVFTPEEVIQLALDRHGDRLGVSWSGGKCSTAVLFMALQVKPDIPVVFNNTLVQFPETYKFIKRIQAQWRLNLYESRPEKTFWQCVEEYGFPMFRGQQFGGRNPGTPRCCYHLKEAPAKRIMEEHGLEATLTGLRVGESRVRMFGVRDHGQFYFNKQYRIWRYHPIAFWTEDQVWEYHDRHKIPHNPVYDMGHSRLGCWPCTGYKTWKESLARSHPKMYSLLMKKLREAGDPRGLNLITDYEEEALRTCRQTALEEFL